MIETRKMTMMIKIIIITVIISRTENSISVNGIYAHDIRVCTYVYKSTASCWSYGPTGRLRGVSETERKSLAAIMARVPTNPIRRCLKRYNKTTVFWIRVSASICNTRELYDLLVNLKKILKR